MENQSCCQETSCCCGAQAARQEKWISGYIGTPVGEIPQVTTELSWTDVLGSWKRRWAFGRMDYIVDPGLYCAGNPDEHSPVLVTANYKMTFDRLRRELSGLDCWLLVLDTKGVNVWCAAGKGTFGTAELIKRIAVTEISGVVSHKRLILPQLGAVGVSAPEVNRQTGFAVIYGPVRAKNIRAFIEAGYTATEDMRTVKFSAWDRLALTPVELVEAAKVSLTVFGVLFLLNLIAARPFGLADFLAYAGAVVTGAVLTPFLLPFIPGRAFAWKGWLLGLLWTAGWIWSNGWLAPGALLLGIGYLLVLPSLSAYLSMNFTGSSTYTSFSGVMKEMKISLPLIISSSFVGIVLILIQSFIA